MLTIYTARLCVSIYHIAILNLNNDLLFDDVVNTPDESDIGYMVEVDLPLPKAIHELLKQFVPCPEQITPQPEWFSDSQTQVQLLTHAVIKKRFN